MRSVLTAALALSVAGCAAIHPTTSDGLADADPEHVHETRFVVSPPVAKAFSNVNKKARQCWSHSAGWPFTVTFRIEGDPFEDDLGFARVTLHGGGSVVVTVVTLRPDASGGTLVVARNLKTPSGSHLGFTDLPFIGDWASGKAVDCTVRLML